MTENARNCEIQKQEPITPPTTPIKTSAKEKLNLHVKRRLQQDSVDANEQKASGPVGSNTKDNESSLRKNKLLEVESISNEKQGITRKSYQKRTDRINSDGSAVVRKYKRNKNKQTVATTISNKVEGISSEVAGPLNAMPISSVNLSGNGDDGDGSHDGHEIEPKYAGVTRDKDKSADVLGLVLSAKKNALMQNPEVQAFLKEIMEVIKS